MNKIKFSSFIMTLFFIIWALCCVSPRMADAGDYLGDFCWDFAGKIYGSSGTLQLGVSHIGGGHYLCSGMFTVNDSTSTQFSTFGNAELIGGDIHVTLSFAGIRKNDIGIKMIRAILDSNSLNGSFESYGVYYDSMEISDGILKHISCQ